MAGILLGMLLTAVVVWRVMPGMMIVTHESKLAFDETVTALESSIGSSSGWVVQGVNDMGASLKKQGRNFDHRVKSIKLCNPIYAERVLQDERWASSLMPCSFAIWEDNSGRVFVSKMNTGLMGRMFGGTIAEVMGGYVAQDEKSMLEPVLVD